ncbi:MAG: hypothetical protein OXG05_05915 [Gammaproteobacteria bacterium]|nr:hypothetical protein [Gammaproteobacteria bacterium]
MNLSHPAVAGAISCVMVAIAMVFSDVILGMGVLVPILDNFVEARRATGESVGFVEAVTVFVLVMGYMLVITFLVGIAALSGWVVSKLSGSGGFSLQGLMNLFRVEEPE